MQRYVGLLTLTFDLSTAQVLDMWFSTGRSITTKSAWGSRELYTRPCDYDLQPLTSWLRHGFASHATNLRIRCGVKITFVTFCCYVTNLYGTDMQIDWWIQLVMRLSYRQRQIHTVCRVMIAAPSAPRDVIITWYNATSARLQWAPPRQTNGRVDIYQLKYRHSSASYTGLLT